MSWDSIETAFLNYGLLPYVVSTLCFAICPIAVLACLELSHYSETASDDYDRMLSGSGIAPGMAIITPVCNQSSTIASHVRALLADRYPNYELIIVNDGSTDDTLGQLIRTYDLAPLEVFQTAGIQTKPVRNIYKSKDPSLQNLIVVDKENGGRADALNAGVNVATRQYIVCISPDYELAPDALLKLARPLLDQSEVRVIAAGGAIRIPDSGEFLPRALNLEYLRTFLFDRMAWSRLNGLLLTSDMMLALDREILLACGGYDRRAIDGEMEALVRMRKYMFTRNKPNGVTCVPDTLCLIKTPFSYKVLGQQRNNHMRATVHTIARHSTMLFNPRYSFLGIISFPYWLFFSVGRPIIEFAGFILLLAAFVTGHISWISFFAALLLICSLCILFSFLAILAHTFASSQFRRPRDILNLLTTAMIEPFFFRPFLFWSSIRGLIDQLLNKPRPESLALHDQPRD